MNEIIIAATRALKNLLIPGMIKFFIACFLLSLVGLGLFIYGSVQLLQHIVIPDMWLLDDAAQSLIDWGGPMMATIVAWFMFPLVMPVIVSFFDEYIAERIERHEYPKLAIGKGQPFWPDLRHDIWFTLKAILLNILVLPLYFLPPFNLFIYYLLNGYLLGKQFFIMAAGRHLGKPEANRLSQQYRWTVLIAGASIAALATVPVINLITPFWGVAMMVHLYQILADKKNNADKQEVLPPPTIET